MSRHQFSQRKKADKSNTKKSTKCFDNHEDVQILCRPCPLSYGPISADKVVEIQDMIYLPLEILVFHPVLSVAIHESDPAFLSLLFLSAFCFWHLQKVVAAVTSYQEN